MAARIYLYYWPNSRQLFAIPNRAYPHKFLFSKRVFWLSFCTFSASILYILVLWDMKTTWTKTEMPRGIIRWWLYALKTAATMLLVYKHNNFGLLRANFDYFLGLQTVGTFILNVENGSALPELKLSQPIQWPRGRPPLAVPLCGFKVYISSVRQLSRRLLVMAKCSFHPRARAHFFFFRESTVCKTMQLVNWPWAWPGVWR